MGEKWLFFEDFLAILLLCDNALSSGCFEVSDMCQPTILCILIKYGFYGYVRKVVARIVLEKLGEFADVFGVKFFGICVQDHLSGELGVCFEQPK